MKQEHAPPHSPPVIRRRCDGPYQPTTTAADACCDSPKNATWHEANDRAAMALQLKYQDAGVMA